MMGRKIVKFFTVRIVGVNYNHLGVIVKFFAVMIVDDLSLMEIIVAHVWRNTGFFVPRWSNYIPHVAN